MVWVRGKDSAVLSGQTLRTIKDGVVQTIRWFQGPAKLGEYLHSQGFVRA